MNVLESKIFDIINYCLSKIQVKTDIIRSNSFLLLNIDLFIFFAIIVTLIISAFAPTEIIGTDTIIVPNLTVLKVLITKTEKIELEKANFFLLIYLIICFISNFTSSMIPQSLYGFMKTGIYFAFYFALCQFLKNNKKYVKYIFIILAVLVSVESFVGIIQNFFRVENISTWQDTSYVNPEDVLSRVYGTLKPYNPNLFAGWLIASFPALLGLWALSGVKIKSLSKLEKVIFSITGLFVFASALTIFLTGCRGAYVALFVIFSVIVIASFYLVFFNNAYKNLKRLWTKLFTSLCLLSAIFIAFNHGILKRIMSIFIMREDSSTSFRMNVYSSAVQMFQDNWLQGIGVGNKVFREIYGLYMLSGFDALSCYCVFLEMAVESGIFALLAFLLYLYFLFKAGIQTFIRNNDIKTKIIVFVSFLSVFAVMIHGFVDTVYFRPQIQFVFWTMAAVLLTFGSDKLEDK